MLPRQDPDRTQVKATLLVAGLIVVLGGAALAPALPSIRDHFRDVENIDYLARFVLTLPAFFIAITAPAAGYLVDRMGRLRILLASLLLAGLAGTAAYFLTSIITVLISRAVVGIAVAGLMTSGTTLIADYYTGEERGRLLGLQTGLMGVAGTVSLMFTGVLADIGWNIPFLLHLAALAILPFALWFLHEPNRTQRCQGDHPPVGEPGACAGESVVQEDPVPPADRSAAADSYKLLAVIYLIVIFVQINFYIVPLYLPFYLGELIDASATQSGIAISFISLSYSLSSIFLGKVVARQDRINVLMGAFVILAVGYSLISFGAATLLLYVGLVVGGVGLGIMMPSLYVWIADAAPVEIRGRALGGFTTAVFLGQFLSPLLSQPLIDATDLGRTMLIASLVLVAIVPILFFGRTGLRALGASG